MQFASIRPHVRALLVPSLLAGLAASSFGQQSQSPVSSQNVTITYGQSFTPSYSGGSGNGNWEFCIGGYTNWNPGNGEPAGTELSNGTWETAWTPPAANTNPGYSFYIAHCGNGTYANATAGWYTLTVNKANQPTVSSTNPTISYSNGAFPPFSPPEYGGAGNGGWQFCVGGYTNWNPGPGQPTGTELPNGQWVSTWTPAVAGTYNFYIVNNGDSNYNESNAAGWYQLTVTGGVDGITWNGTGLPGTGTSNQTINCTASVANSGSSVWGNSYDMQVSLNGTQVAIVSIANVYPQGGPSSPTSASPGYSITLPTVSTPTSFQYEFRAMNSGGQYFGQPYYATITVNPPAPSITSSSSASGSVGASFSYQITATNSPTSYSSSSLPSGLSLNSSTGLISGTPTTAGNPAFSVSASNATGTGSETVTLSISQGTQPAVSISPNSPSVSVGQQVTLTASGGAGTGAYVWGEGASGTGTTTSVSFATPGNYPVSVYRAGDSNYQQSAFGYATVAVQATQTVTLSPSGTSGTLTVAQNTTVMFSASGGQTSYVWGGSASGSNAMEAVTFNTVGSGFYVNVYSVANSTYQKSNTAQITVNVVSATSDPNSANTQLKVLVPTP